MENTSSVDIGAERELVLTRTLSATRDHVFEVWTNPKHVENWWGPEDFTVPHCAIDLRLGGSFHICMRSPTGEDYWNKGFYRVIRSPEQIVSTIFFSDKDGNFIAPSKYGMGPDFPAEILMTVSFTDAGNGKTKLTLNCGLSEVIAKRYQADQGWSQSLDRFEQELKRE